jgi:hypothetical protein
VVYCEGQNNLKSKPFLAGEIGDVAFGFGGGGARYRAGALSLLKFCRRMNIFSDGPCSFIAALLSQIKWKVGVFAQIMEVF